MNAKDTQPASLPEQLAEAKRVLGYIANARRFDRECFDGDTEFADWAQSWARHALHVSLRDPAADELPPCPPWVPAESNDELSPFEGELYRDVLAERAIATLADNEKAE